jgi:hypothetical protein
MGPRQREPIGPADLRAEADGPRQVHCLVSRRRCITDGVHQATAHFDDERLDLSVASYVIAFESPLLVEPDQEPLGIHAEEISFRSEDVASAWFWVEALVPARARWDRNAPTSFSAMSLGCLLPWKRMNLFIQETRRSMLVHR